MMDSLTDAVEDLSTLYHKDSVRFFLTLSRSLRPGMPLLRVPTSPNSRSS